MDLSWTDRWLAIPGPLAELSVLWRCAEYAKRNIYRGYGSDEIFLNSEQCESHPDLTLPLPLDRIILIDDTHAVLHPVDLAELCRELKPALESASTAKNSERAVEELLSDESIAFLRGRVSRTGANALTSYVSEGSILHPGNDVDKQLILQRLTGGGYRWIYWTPKMGTTSVEVDRHDKAFERISRVFKSCDSAKEASI
jgi:hypothetical protein